MRNRSTGRTGSYLEASTTSSFTTVPSVGTPLHHPPSFVLSKNEDFHLTKYPILAEYAKYDTIVSPLDEPLSLALYLSPKKLRKC